MGRILTSPSTVSTRFSPTVASIDLSALRRNLKTVRALLRPGCALSAIVKADAYGHGAAAIARTLASGGVAHFGVATVQEGRELREAGLSHDIIVMGGIFPELIGDLIELRLTPVIHDADCLAAFGDAVPPPARPYPVHLKVDTGMTRLGFPPEQILHAARSPLFGSTLRLNGLMTHLSDADGEDRTRTIRQISTFRHVAQTAAEAGIDLPFLHAANSAGLVAYPDAQFTMVRPGLLLYGYAMLPPGIPQPEVAPILSWRARVIQIRRTAAGQAVSYNGEFMTKRPSRLAVLAVGYADGYPRALSNRGAVLLHGRRAPIVGRVCMDMTIVDVTTIPEARAGDHAVLIGCDGDDHITAADVAAWADTIPYEILSTIGRRVGRVYLDPDSDAPA